MCSRSLHFLHIRAEQLTGDNVCIRGWHVVFHLRLLGLRADADHMDVIIHVKINVGEVDDTAFKRHIVANAGRVARTCTRTRFARHPHECEGGDANDGESYVGHRPIARDRAHDTAAGGVGDRHIGQLNAIGQHAVGSACSTRPVEIFFGRSEGGSAHAPLPLSVRRARMLAVLSP